MAGMSRIGCVLMAFGLVCSGFGQERTTFEGRSAWQLANDRIELVILENGGAFASLVLRDDPERMNPMWNPIRMARELGQEPRATGGVGHFVCVDGFGPVSEQEKAAGLPGHGEAHRRPWELVHGRREAGLLEVRLRTHLPLVQENFTRVVRLVDGEQVVYVHSELENLLAFDRPIAWAEHATIGSPFLAPEITVVDLSAGVSETRPYAPEQASRRRLMPGKLFTWPWAPSRSGELINLRAAPSNPDSVDHTTTLLDPNRPQAWVTALNLQKRLLLGYVFRRAEFPWLQTWENYPPTLKMARGIEFSTQPYDEPRRLAIGKGTYLGVPTYRWLPAKSTISADFLMFYTRVPDGFRRVDDVRWMQGELWITDSHAGLVVRLKASRGLETAEDKPGDR